jgi:hypothetical protein
MESAEIAGRVYRDWKVTCRSLRVLQQCGLIHISGWRKVGSGGGHPAKLWAFGHGNDAPKPPSVDAQKCRRESRNRRLQFITKQYGKDIAKRIFTSRGNGGADRVVIDGITIYQRKRINRMSA